MQRLFATSLLTPMCLSKLVLTRSISCACARCGSHAHDTLCLRIRSACAGVEMEALTAVSTAALTVYDMCKAISKTISITDVRLEAKSGGRSGDWKRPT